MYEYRYLYIYLFIFEIQSQLQLVTAIIVYVVNSDACFKRFVCLWITFIYAHFALFDVSMPSVIDPWDIVDHLLGMKFSTFAFILRFRCLWPGLRLVWCLLKASGRYLALLLRTREYAWGLSLGGLSNKTKY